MTRNLEPHNILITGASSGIGEATARAFAREGAQVVLVSQCEPELNAVVKSINESGGRAFALVADFAKQSEVEGLFCQAEELVGPVDVLVNNAGIGMMSSVLEAHPDDMRLLFEVNYFALSSLCQQALRQMAPRGKGRIINVSSASGRFGCSQFSAYSASKGAVHAFTEALHYEAFVHGIYVTEILPISVQTPFFDNVKGNKYKPKGLVITVETVAKSMVKCVASKRPPAEILPYPWVRAAFLLNTLFPGILVKWSGKLYAKRVKSGSIPLKTDR